MTESHDGYKTLAESSDEPADGSSTEPTVARAGLILAGLTGASAVAIGAFGAHGLPDWLADAGVDAETIARRIDQFETGARYHLAHAIVLLVLALAPIRPTRWLRAVRGLMFAGVVFFSGSLYLLVLTNTPVLGAITPIGGVCWIVAWTLLIGLRASSES